MKTALIYGIFYFASLPLIVKSFEFAGGQLRQRFTPQLRFNQNQKVNLTKQSYLSKAREALSFIFKMDTRKSYNIPNKAIVGNVYLVGFILSIVSAFSGTVVLLFVSLLFPFITVGIARIIFSPIKKEREIVLDKIHSLKRDRMGLKEKGKGADFSLTPKNSEFEVLAWDTDFVSPTKLRLFLPTNFDPISEGAFLEQFNVYLSKGSAKWAPDRTDPKDRGWNYGAGHVTLMRMPPLPLRAPWNERYLLNDNIAWSYFPLALGVENGVKITNEETGQDEYVLGFDVAGDQRKKKGVQVGEEVVMAPQVLIAGSTGGGKSLSVDTIVPTVVDKDEE